MISAKSAPFIAIFGIAIAANMPSASAANSQDLRLAMVNNCQQISSNFRGVCMRNIQDDLQAIVDQANITYDTCMANGGTTDSCGAEVQNYWDTILSYYQK